MLTEDVFVFTKKLLRPLTFFIFWCCLVELFPLNSNQLGFSTVGLHSWFFFAPTVYNHTNYRGQTFVDNQTMTNYCLSLFLDCGSYDLLFIFKHFLKQPSPVWVKLLSVITMIIKVNGVLLSKQYISQHNRI